MLRKVENAALAEMLLGLKPFRFSFHNPVINDRENGMFCKTAEAGI
jgi:hypothetical protein